MNAFEKIAGYPREKEELLALAEIFSHRKKYELKGASLPKGIVFYGPAGTGKTLFAEVLAAECSLAQVKISLSDAKSETGICRQIRKAFLQAAKSRTPTMIFFDELDKVLPNEHEEYYTDRAKTILTQLLTLIDGMDSVKNVVFVATCNDYGALPESITRPGRFDKKICLDLPDLASRVAILSLYMKPSPVHFAMTEESIAKLTAGFSPAALKTLVNDCILSSDDGNCADEELIRRKIREIREEDLPTERSEKSYTVDAVRNIGAFLIAREYSKSDYVLTADGSKLANTYLAAVIADVCCDHDDYDDYDDCDDEWGDQGRKSPPRGVASKNDYIAAITSLLGGMAAEELIFNKVYNNLKDSLRAVDEIMLEMTTCGMLGLPLYFESTDRYNGHYPQYLLEARERAFTELRLECYEKAKEQLAEKIGIIRRLTTILIKRKSIEKAECEALIASLLEEGV